MTDPKGGGPNGSARQLGLAFVGDGDPLLGAGSQLHKTTVNRPHPPHPPASEAFDAKAKARFWRKVSPAPSDSCWIWRGAIGNTGYGNVGRFGRTYLAHRVAYELTHGPVPAGKDLDHLCRNRPCVNPAHLEPVTFLANMRRRYAENPDERPTHCISGHELTPENTMRLRSTGQLRCRACERPATARGPRESCLHGHPFTEENTYVNPRGERSCRTCRAAHVKAHRARKSPIGGAS